MYCRSNLTNYRLHLPWNDKYNDTRWICRCEFTAKYVGSPSLGCITRKLGLHRLINVVWSFSTIYTRNIFCLIENNFKPINNVLEKQMKCNILHCNNKITNIHTHTHTIYIYPTFISYSTFKLLWHPSFQSFGTCTWINYTKNIF